MRIRLTVLEAELVLDALEHQDREETDELCHTLRRKIDKASIGPRHSQRTVYIKASRPIIKPPSGADE